MWVGLLCALILNLFQLSQAKYDCSVHIEADFVYGDTQVEHARISRTVATTKLIPPSGLGRLPAPITNSQAGENGIKININNGTLLLFPMGKQGLNLLYVFDVSSKAWDIILVHCPPQGVALWGDKIMVGFCVVNTSTWCVPYFKLTFQDDGEWVDDSGSGFMCSRKLSTANLTNPVILQFDTQYGYAVKLYFAELGTNILHEIDLGQQEPFSYDVPDYGEHELKVNHLVSAVANDGSFTGLRLESSTDNSNDIYHAMFSSNTQSFSQKVIPSETIAFNSDNLEYLVTFTENHKTMTVISENGTTRSYLVDSRLQDPICCENMVGPGAHHLVCLAAKTGLVLINVKDGTSQTIPIDSNVTNIGKLTNDTLYLLTTEQEMIVLPISAPKCLVKLTVHNDNLRVMNSLEYDYSSTQNNGKDVPVWSIALSGILGGVALVVIIAVLSVCAWKKHKCITDKLSQYFKYQKLDNNQDDDIVSVQARQCTDESVVMPAPELRSPADGKSS